MKFNILV